MEKNVSKKISEYTNKYKNNLSNWIKNNNITLKDESNKDRTSEFIQYLLDFPNLELSVDDFKKRKRIKNTIPDYERCIALKCNGERCSRKKKNNNFCGTHFKGTPYGTTNNDENAKKETVKLWLQEINGISKYIDKDFNVYSTSDIVNAVSTPRIVGKYGIKEDNHYYIINS